MTHKAARAALESVFDTFEFNYGPKSTQSFPWQDHHVNAVLAALAPHLLPEGSLAACRVCGNFSMDWPDAPHNSGKCNSYAHVEEDMACPFLPPTPESKP